MATRRALLGSTDGRLRSLLARELEQAAVVVSAVDTSEVAGWAREFEIRGTPGVVVNGWRLPSVPSVSELVTLVDTLLSGGTLES